MLVSLSTSKSCAKQNRVGFAAGVMHLGHSNNNKCKKNEQFMFTVKNAMYTQ